MIPIVSTSIFATAYENIVDIFTIYKNRYFYIVIYKMSSNLTIKTRHKKIKPIVQPKDESIFVTAKRQLAGLSPRLAVSMDTQKNPPSNITTSLPNIDDIHSDCNNNINNFIDASKLMRNSSSRNVLLTPIATSANCLRSPSCVSSKRVSPTKIVMRPTVAKKSAKKLPVKKAKILRPTCSQKSSPTVSKISLPPPSKLYKAPSLSPSVSRTQCCGEPVKKKPSDKSESVVDLEIEEDFTVPSEPGSVTRPLTRNQGHLTIVSAPRLTAQALMSRKISDIRVEDLIQTNLELPILEEPVPPLTGSISSSRSNIFNFREMTPLNIIYNTLCNDMFVFVETQFGDRFITYFPSDIVNEEGTIREFANIPTTFVNSEILYKVEDAKRLGVEKLSEYAGIATGHIKPEIFDPASPIIGAASVDASIIENTKLCAVIFEKETPTFIAMVEEDDRTPSSHTAPSEAYVPVPFVVYPIVHGYNFTRDKYVGTEPVVQKIVQSVHTVSTKLVQKSLVDTQQLLECVLNKYTHEIHHNLSLFMSRAIESDQVRDVEEYTISELMGTAARYGDIEAYGNLSNSFREHRLYSIRTKDSVSCISQALTEVLGELNTLLKKTQARLYIDSHKTLSLKTSNKFLSAEAWGYPEVFDSVDFTTLPISSNSEENSLKILHPEVFEAALETGV
jgi:hypothetical protein